ncbi:MAG: pyridoxal phosphate-dependent aminotransferase [Methanobacteriota archaeon]
MSVRPASAGLMNSEPNPPPMTRSLFAKRMEGLQVSGVRKMFELAPKGAINLGLGEPDFPPPPHVAEALGKAVLSGKNGYGPTLGVPELRNAVVEYVKRFRSDVEQRNVMITCGATQALMVAAQTLYNQGDEIIIPDPGFVLYAPHARMAGAKPFPYKLSQENDFRPDMEELKDLVSPRTKAIIVNSPGNPTGGVFTRDDLKAIADLAADYKVVVISDEVYDSIVYDAPHESFLSASDLLVYVNSFSKVYSLTGWRVGFMVTSGEIMTEMAKTHYYDVACPSTPAQHAALAGMRGQQAFIDERRQEYKARRDLLVKSLNTIEGFACTPPKGTFYAFPGFDFDITSHDLAMLILKAGVICTPGTAFGQAGEGHIRFSFAASREDIEKAMPIVENAVKGLKRKK